MDIMPNDNENKRINRYMDTHRKEINRDLKKKIKEYCED